MLRELLRVRMGACARMDWLYSTVYVDHKLHKTLLALVLPPRHFAATPPLAPDRAFMVYLACGLERADKVFHRRGLSRGAHELESRGVMR